VCYGNHNLERKSTREIIFKRGIPPLFRQFTSLESIKIRLQSTFANNLQKKRRREIARLCVVRKLVGKSVRGNHLQIVDHAKKASRIELLY